MVGGAQRRRPRWEPGAQSAKSQQHNNTTTHANTITQPALNYQTSTTITTHITRSENLEGEYSGLEHEVVDGVVESLKVITEEKSLRIAEYAFEFAYLNHRQRVTAVHKANIMKKGDGMFLKVSGEGARERGRERQECLCCWEGGEAMEGKEEWSEMQVRLQIPLTTASPTSRRLHPKRQSTNNKHRNQSQTNQSYNRQPQACQHVAKRYPDIEYTEMIVDNTCMQLVSKPDQFDVMVAPNLYGNLVANVVAGLCGGNGVVPGGNIGNDYAVFEQGARAVSNELAGRGVANPTALALSTSMMLRHLGLHSFSDRCVF